MELSHNETIRSNYDQISCGDKDIVFIRPLAYDDLRYAIEGYSKSISESCKGTLQRFDERHGTDLTCHQVLLGVSPSSDTY